MANTPGDPSTTTQRRKRGFAAMDPERQREIARLGGRAAHEQGSAHQFTPQEARLAGIKGRAGRSSTAVKASGVGSAAAK